MSCGPSAAPSLPSPQRIASYRFHLDHLGTRVGEQLRAVRTGDQRADVHQRRKSRSAVKSALSAAASLSASSLGVPLRIVRPQEDASDPRLGTQCDNPDRLASCTWRSAASPRSWRHTSCRKPRP